ncbi:MAG TPA: Hsp20/alpha crystallin family protein [Thermoanaerobaculia bacterium]|jgi:HSP20 family protein|nr:Hsp20/alpha crystallin family protein [Thermoanaerobaculia bacterium]
MGPFRKIYLDELTRIQDRINSLFEQALVSAEFEEREGGVPGSWAPAVDVIETADAYLVFAELSDVRREEVQLQVEERRLELSGRRQPSSKHRNFLRMERSYGPFRRSFELGAAVDVDGISAGLEHGVLRVHVPKLQATRAGATPEPPETGGES